MVETEKIQVLLVDDSEGILEFLNAFLAKKTNIEVIGQASDGRQAIDLSSQLQPDVILMDINMPILNGIEATKEILNHYPSTKVIGFSSMVDEITTKMMCQAGACGLLLKTSNPENIFKSIVDAVTRPCQRPPQNGDAMGNAPDFRP
jgi:DNA-binding NarL/FixJ family response regulator